MATSGIGNKTKYTSSQASKDLLKLFKCTVDIGKEVLIVFVDNHVLSSYNGNFSSFLEFKKHDIYHQFDAKNILSCRCSAVGCRISKISKIDGWMFNKLYDDTFKNEKFHHVVRNGRLEQICLHRYIAKNIQVHELDINNLYHIIKIGAHLSFNEKSALDSIRTVRNQVCHVWSTSCFSSTELEDKWNTLTKSVLDLTDPPYRRMIEKQVNEIRENEISSQKVAELTEKINELLQELKRAPDNNNVTLEEDTIRNCVKEETQLLKNELSLTNDNIQAMLTDQRDLKYAIDELKIDIKVLKDARTLIPESSIKGDNEIPVLWKFEIPKGFDVKEVVLTVQNKLKDDIFKVKYVREGSLLIMTTVSAEVLNNKDLFEKSIKIFLSKLVDVCNIDTKVPCHVHVELQIIDTDNVEATNQIFERKTESKNQSTQTDSDQNSGQENTRQSIIVAVTYQMIERKKESKNQSTQTEPDQNSGRENIRQSILGRNTISTKSTQTDIDMKNFDKARPRTKWELKNKNTDSDWMYLKFRKDEESKLAKEDRVETTPSSDEKFCELM